MDDFSARDVCDNFQLVWTFQWSLNKKKYQPELLTVSCKYNSEIFVFLFFLLKLTVHPDKKSTF